MPANLLATKLYIPKPRPQLVPRPRLLDRLNAGLDGNLTLISAPAGFGKTSLVSAWAHQTDLPVAWLSVDENDNDLVRFMKYLVGALGRIEEGIGADVQAALDSTQAPQDEILLTGLVNDIARLERQFTLVLDDCHLLTSQPIHDAIEFLVNNLPPHMHLIIISRVDLPIPYSRLRASGQLVEIRSNDLRFTEGETAELLNDLMGLEMSVENIRALERRTEGWIVGLHLAALSLQGRDDKHEFVRDFSGSHHYIIDYLLEEVLSRQPKEIQSFLCRTSILDHLSDDICDDVLEITTSRESLQTLADTNLFLIPLDDQRKWYRYHHLFSEFLRSCLEDSEPESISGLHLRAAQWYEREGLIQKAVSHALAANEHQEAGRLVEQSAAQMLDLSELAELMKLVDMLPEEEVISRPRLSIYHSWALRLSGRPYDVVESRLRDAERALEVQRKHLSQESEGQAKSFIEEDLSNLQCHLNALNAFQALFREDIPQVIELALKVQACCPEESFLCSSTAFALGWAYRFSGDLEAANLNFSESTALAHRAGNTYFAVATQCRAAYALVLAGKLRDANDSFQKAVLRATRDDGRQLPVAGYAHVYLGGIYYEWNELAAARRYLEEGILQCQRVGYFMDQAVGCINLSKMKLAQKDVDGAREALQTALKVSERMRGYLYVQRWVEDGHVRFWLAQRNFSNIKRWIRECGLGIDDELDFKRDMEHLILARALVGMGRDQPEEPYTQDALILLRRLLEMAESAGWMGKAIEILVLQAMALQLAGQNQAAINALKKALDISRPEGYLRTFIDEGLPMATLLQKTAKKGIYPEYTELLLNHINGEIMPAGHPSQIPEMVDPLSARELEVLRLLATDLSGPEIARELSIALTTVRYHTRNIYSKLNANNRRTAIRIAEELNLV